MRVFYFLESIFKISLRMLSSLIIRNTVDQLEQIVQIFLKFEKIARNWFGTRAQQNHVTFINTSDFLVNSPH